MFDNIRLMKLAPVFQAVVVGAGVWFAMAAHAKPDALDSMFDSDGAVWKLDAGQFMAEHEADGFRWMTATSHDAARAANGGLTFLGLRVWEVVVRFETNQPKQFTFSLYNRGDAGDMDEAAFGKFLLNIDTLFTKWTGDKGTAFRTQERTAASSIRRKAWVKALYRADLVWGFSEKSRQQGISAPRPEFVRLEITPFEARRDPRKQVIADTGTAAKQATAFDLRTRVQRRPNGDVVIPTVPMVDQGQKGYCAAAVSERLLRYYGRNVDEHEIAQLANTSADGGTSQSSMVAALRRIGDEQKMELTIFQENNLQEFERLLKDYNRFAKRAGKPNAEMMGNQVGNTRTIDPMATYKSMDPALLKEARLKRDTGMQEFKNAVMKSINAGAPLSWSVILGIVKEPATPQAFGGHMRLIIGYNTRTGDILYTDTWGAGHELKQLPLADAWTITTGLYCLHLRDVRF